MPFCPGTKRWDRTPDTEMPFCPRPRRFVPGQKGGTEGLGQNVWDRRAGTERLGQKGWGRRAGTERSGTIQKWGENQREADIWGC